MSEKTTQKIQTELVYGIHPILELLKAKRRKLPTLYTTKPEPKAWALIAPLIPPYTKVQYVTREALTNIAKTTDHQGVVGWAMPFQFRKKPFEPSKSPFLLMLDGIQDARNLGAIIRSAYCTGVNGVIITAKNSAPIHAPALKAAAGLAEHLDIIQAPTAKAATQELAQAGYNLYLATLAQGVDATTVSYQEPLCLVIGSEGTGVSPDILKAGTRITLPQRTSDISYNASVAAGILLFLIGSKSKKGI
jgi:23S rRNA (guanosine2251-2'-O)-methyltransferase